MDQAEPPACLSQKIVVPDQGLRFGRVDQPVLAEPSQGAPRRSATDRRMISTVREQEVLDEELDVDQDRPGPT